ncbi:hypothetical protein RSAG8_10504, partial [Rhizoctonia solani AG-8 WAC10335]
SRIGSRDAFKQSPLALVPTPGNELGFFIRGLGLGICATGDLFVFCLDAVCSFAFSLGFFFSSFQLCFGPLELVFELLDLFPRSPCLLPRPFGLSHRFLSVFLGLGQPPTRQLKLGLNQSKFLPNSVHMCLFPLPRSLKLDLLPLKLLLPFLQHPPLHTLHPLRPLSIPLPPPFFFLGDTAHEHRLDRTWRMARVYRVHGHLHRYFGHSVSLGRLRPDLTCEIDHATEDIGDGGARWVVGSRHLESLKIRIQVQSQEWWLCGAGGLN